MSVISSSPQHNRRTLRRAVFPILLCTATAAFLAGCGGGGSNGNSGSGTTTTGSSTGNNTSGNNTSGNNGSNTGVTPPSSPDSSVTGRIVDTAGNGVPGASVIADTGGSAATSLSQGGYRLDITSGVVHRINATATRNGVIYSGSTQVMTFSDSLTSNTNIILSDISRQASVSGVVQNSAGQPLAGARVYLAQTSTVSGSNSSSLVAYTNASGAYTLSSIPVDVPSSVSLTLSASKAGYQNVTQTLSNVGAGGAYNQTLTLQPSTAASIQPPTLTAAYTSTEPAALVSSSARAAHAATGAASAYEALRRRLSPGYAALANKHGAHGTRRTAHAAGNYAVETDLQFTEDSLTSSSVLAYSVYRTSGSILPTASANAFYDQVQDPLANYYTDLTFSNFTTNTLSGVKYNFGLTAVSTSSTGSVESALSPVVSVTPLGPLTLSAPTAGLAGTNPVAVSWGAVSGVTNYHAYLYTEFPTISTTPQDLTAASPLPATTTSIALPTLTVGQQYYIVIVGTSDQAESASSTALTTGAALTFSPITPFTVTK